MKAIGEPRSDLILRQVCFVDNDLAHRGGSKGTSNEDVKDCRGLGQGHSSVAGKSGRIQGVFESRVHWSWQ